MALQFCFESLHGDADALNCTLVVRLYGAAQGVE